MGSRYTAHVNAADTALSLLFRKLHPLLEDAAHALASRAPRKELERLHAKLVKARLVTAEALEKALPDIEDEALAEAVAELADNLQPSGEGFQESLTLTQLCLEDAPETFLPFVPAPEEAPWMKRLEAFQALIQAPAQRAESRWESIDPELGEQGGFED